MVKMMMRRFQSFILVFFVCILFIEWKSHQQQMQFGQENTVIHIGCIGFNTASTRHSIQGAIEYMTRPGIYPSTSSFPTQYEFERNDTVNSFFGLESKLSFTVHCLNGNLDLSEQNARALYLNHSVVAIIGDSFSSGSVRASRVANEFKRPLISHAATSAALSNKTEHPFFARTTLSDDHQAKFIVEYLSYIQQLSFNIIYSNDAYGTMMANEIEKIAKTKAMNIEKKISVPFQEYNQNPVLYDNLIDELDSSTSKVHVVIMTSIPSNEHIVISAHSKGLLESPNIWIFSEIFVNLFSYSINGSIQVTSPNLISRFADPESILDGILHVRIIDSIWSSRRFFNQYMQSSPFQQIGFDSASYDAMLAIGLAIKKMIQKNESILDGSTLYKRILETNFVGASGRIRFDANGDRLGGRYSMDNFHSRKYERVSIFSIESGLQILSHNITLPGGRTYEFQRQDTSNTAGVNQWKPIEVVPKGRFGSQYSVDIVNSQIILFSGYDLDRALGDLWMYSFTNEMWRKVIPFSKGPAARYGGGSVNIAHNFIIYGGFDGSRFLGDVWIYDTRKNEWKEVQFPLTAPHPGYRSGIRLIRYQNDIYLFSGNVPKTCVNDLWKLDTSVMKWIEIKSVSSIRPSARYKSCFTLSGNKFILWGGKSCEGASMNDMWFFDLQNKTWNPLHQINAPAVRYDMNCEVVGPHLYISGGYSKQEGIINSFERALVNEQALQSGTIVWSMIYNDISGHMKRDSTQFVRYDNFLIWFGGWPVSSLLNDMWSYNVHDKDISKVHDNFQFVDGITNGCYARSGNIIYAFGGRTEREDASNHLYTYNIVERGWSLIAISGEQFPMARRDCSLVASGGNLYLYGGRHGEQYFGDHWVFFSSLKRWSRLEQKGQVPSARATHASTIFRNESLYMLFGGRNAVQSFRDIFIYDIEMSSWSQVEYPEGPEDIIPMETVSSSIALLEKDRKMVLYGGTNMHGDPSLAMLSFDLTTSKWSKFSSPSVEYIYRSRIALTAVSDHGVIVYGGSLFLDLTDGMYFISNDTWRKIDTSLAFNSPQPRQNHALFYISNRIIAIHGGGPVEGSEVASYDVILPDIWEYHFSPVCSKTGIADPTLLNSNAGLKQCTQCSPGTYEFRGSCIFCAEGTFSQDFGETSCTKCPPGFFNSIVGANSNKYCLPCPEGTFNHKLGMGQCMKCPDSSYCPIGSIWPRLNDTVETTLVSEQPLPYVAQTQKNMIATIITYSFSVLVSISIGIPLLILSNLSSKAEKWISKLDFFFSGRHQYKLGFLELKQTYFGGIFSIITILVVIFTLCTNIFVIVNDSLQERRSLIPNLIVSQRGINSDLQFEFIATGRIESCESSETTEHEHLMSQCDSKIIAQFENIQWDEKQKPRMACSHRSSGEYANCTVQVFCKSCTLLSEASLTIHFKDQSYGTLFWYSLNATTGLRTENGEVSHSRIQGEVRAPKNRLFRGSATPTSVTFQTIQTLFNVSRILSRSQETGYHIDFSNVQIGDTVDIYDFSQRSGLAFQFKLVRHLNTLEVIHSDKKDVTGIIAEILGTIVGIFGACGIVMYNVEHVLEEKILKPIRLEKRKKIPEIEQGRDEMMVTFLTKSDETI